MIIPESISNDKNNENINVTIRGAKRTDLSQLITLLSQLNISEESAITLEKAEAVMQQMCNYPFFKIYVAVLNEQIVGAFELLIMDNLGHFGMPSGIIEDMVVADGYRRKGIGRFMMQYAMNICREKGCYKLSLSSNLKREEAHCFYESLGFRKHGFSFYVEVGG